MPLFKHSMTIGKVGCWQTAHRHIFLVTIARVESKTFFEKRAEHLYSN